MIVIICNQLKPQVAILSTNIYSQVMVSRNYSYLKIVIISLHTVISFQASNSIIIIWIHIISDIPIY